MNRVPRWLGNLWFALCMAVAGTVFSLVGFLGGFTVVKLVADQELLKPGEYLGVLFFPFVPFALFFGPVGALVAVPLGFLLRRRRGRILLTLRRGVLFGAVLMWLLATPLAALFLDYTEAYWGGRPWVVFVGPGALLKTVGAAFINPGYALLAPLGAYVGAMLAPICHWWPERRAGGRVSGAGGGAG